eukprot:s5985_g2.t1
MGCSWSWAGGLETLRRAFWPTTAGDGSSRTCPSMIRQGDRGSRIRCFELLIALALCLQGWGFGRDGAWGLGVSRNRHQSSVLNDTEEVFSDGNETFGDALESFTATTTFTTRTRTTTRTLAPESNWDNLTLGSYTANPRKLEAAEKY